MNIKKIAVSLAASAVSIAMMGSTAFAAQVSDRGGININKNIKTTTVMSTNSAQVSNIVGSAASTGGNSVGSAHGDVKGVTVNTGAATTSATVDNTLNNNTVTVNASSCGCGGTASSASSTTASSADQSADRGGYNKVKVRDDAAVGSSNTASAANMLSAGSASGDNSIYSMHGDVMTITMGTGPTMGTTHVGTIANFNAIMVTR